jgi:NADPH:quinone reductase-like Zn-dependent oxidoreductase
MRAFVLQDFESEPAIAQVNRPEAGPGEVLVRVRAPLLNGFDLAVAGGMLKGMLEYRFPVVLGKDFAGTAALAAIDAVAPRAGETVLISGATGGVGAFAVQLAVARGALVIATATPGEDKDFVLALGATHVVDHTADLPAQVRALRPGGIDAVLHLAGDGPQLAGLLVPGGRFASTLGVGSEQLAGQNVRATSIVASPDSATLDLLAAEAAAGRLRAPIQHTYTLEELGQALSDFAGGTRGKLAVVI